MNDSGDFYDRRIPSPADLAFLIKVLRDASEWTQETLAELSGLTVRTIQRVEKGESSSLDTRRALARGFGYDDLDVFEKPWPILNPEKLKAHAEELERTTIVLPLTRIEKASMVRKLIEGAESSVTEELGDLSRNAREALACLVDNLRDYNDVRECFTEHHKLELDETLQGCLATIATEKAAVGVALRRAKLQFRTDGNPIDWTNIYFVLAPVDALPAKIRVPKQVSVA